MYATSRTIVEVTAAAGLDPTTQIDTDDLSPPTYNDILASGEKVVQVIPAQAGLAVAIPDACLLIVISDEPITLELVAGETQLADIRKFEVGGEDETAIAYPAGSIVLIGNGATTATVKILWLDTVV